MIGLAGHGVPIRIVAAYRGDAPHPPLDHLPEPLRGRVDFAQIPSWAPSVRAQANRIRRPIGRLAVGEFRARLEALARDADVFHLDQLETAWSADGTGVPSVVHLHYRIRMDHRPPAPWRPQFRYFSERVAAERAVLRRQRFLLASSPIVADSMKRVAPQAEVVVAPLCLDPQHYLPGPAPDPVVFGVIGTATWPPTAAAMRRLVRRTWPLIRAHRPEARLLVAGHGTTELGLPPTPGVSVLGSVPSAPGFLEGISALLYPLDRGSGMKVKVLEAMASGVPVVTTAAGAEGVAENDGVFVSEDDAALADAAAELAGDSGARRQRSASARETFLRHYSPAPATEPLLDLYTRMAETR
jgi:glycosyltransferase involved in cell wall biosynthesis